MKDAQTIAALTGRYHAATLAHNLATGARDDGMILEHYRRAMFDALAALDDARGIR